MSEATVKHDGAGGFQAIGETPVKPTADQKRWRRNLDRAYVDGFDGGWPNLHFTDSGKQRLAHIVGVANGFELLANEAGAHKLMDDLGQQLDYLNDFGGEVEEEVEGDTIKYPKFRVILGDDGTFGGFGIAWYQAVDQKTAGEWRDALGGVGEHERMNEYREQRDATYRTAERLTLYRAYRPSWAENASKYHRYLHCDVLYRYSFNGGLLFHGLAHDPMAVRIGGKGNLWSVHT